MVLPRVAHPFSPLFPCFHPSSLSEQCPIFLPQSRRDDAYWPESKRVAMEDRYRPGFSRPNHHDFHDFHHRDHGQYQEHSADRSVLPGCVRVGVPIPLSLRHTLSVSFCRREGSRSMMPERDGQVSAAQPSQLLHLGLQLVHRFLS